MVDRRNCEYRIGGYAIIVKRLQLEASTPVEAFEGAAEGEPRKTPIMRTIPDSRSIRVFSLFRGCFSLPALRMPRCGVDCVPDIDSPARPPDNSTP
jgi:hypothetical protein